MSKVLCLHHRASAFFLSDFLVHIEVLVENSNGVGVGAGEILEQDDLDVTGGVVIGLLDLESDSYGQSVGSSVSISLCCGRFVFVLKSESPLVTP